MAAPAPASAPTPTLARKTLCVEGWRGVNHSIAMVNQHQLLALLDDPQLQVYHRDTPFFMPHWTAQRLPAGFSDAEQARIAAVPPPPEGARIDALLRITSPFRTVIDPAVKTLSFMVTECSLVAACFDAPLGDRAPFTRDANRILTPSAWSRDRLVEHGFAPEGIVVLPHGVNARTFSPLAPAARRQARLLLGVADDEPLFVNVGVATWNKGLDFLIHAFATVRARHPRARLLIKENKGLYGLGVDRIVADLQRQSPSLFNSAVLAGISVISNSLDQGQLRTLYAVADAYVSPYRAEGFNLPVLEALACGTPVIVTAGGATDDFCSGSLAIRVPSRPGLRADAPEEVGPFCVPDADALFEAMSAVAAAGAAPIDSAAVQAERQALLARLSWPAVARQLAALV